MIKLILTKAAIFFIVFVHAQNVGIGTTSPTGPLSFASTLGNKIVLWGDGNSNHYGMGVQGGLLQLYSDAAAANIAFGYGRSTAFTERMRILNGGNYDGMVLNGRLLIRNGSNDAVGGGGGVWLYKADNSALLGFMGTQNNQNIGFFGGPAGWGFTYDAINSRVGIGNNNPNAPLAFGAVGGKKITLYPGTLGDAGFGISSNRLQIFSDNPNADVAIGYDAAGVFNERFAVKPNGALALSGNTGSAGQYLRSNGTGAATWASPANPTVSIFNQSGNTSFNSNLLEVEINGLNGVFFVSNPSTVVFGSNLNIVSVNAVATSYGYVEIRIIEGLNNVVATARSTGSMDPLRKTSLHPTGSIVLQPGTYTMKAYLGRLNVLDLPSLSFVEAPSQIWLQVLPN
jgi:hypothetical protein